MHVTIKVQRRGNRLYYFHDTYLTAIDIADYGYCGAAVRATGFYDDEIEEVQASGKAVYTQTTFYRVQRLSDKEIKDSWAAEATFN